MNLLKGSDKKIRRYIDDAAKCLLCRIPYAGIGCEQEEM